VESIPHINQNLNKKGEVFLLPLNLKPNLIILKPLYVNRYKETADLVPTKPFFVFKGQYTLSSVAHSK
jgi:hypothetical protein